MANSALMTKANKEDIIIEYWISYICYPIYFKKNKVCTLIESGNKVNTIILEYILKLDVKVHFTNVRAQKMDGSILEIFEMILASF